MEEYYKKLLEKWLEEERGNYALQKEKTAQR
jgi:hypothetical protein